MRPARVLADGPTGNLDSESGDQVFGLLRRVNQTHGTGLLILTHDPRLARRCDRIVHLSDGCVRSDQTLRAAALPAEVATGTARDEHGVREGSIQALKTSAL
jgi:lipoprotein-releasing system ATP-binding protein